MSKGVNRDVRGVRRSRGAPGRSRVGQGGVKVYQEVKTSVRGVLGVEGGLRDPSRLRWTSWVYQGVKGEPGLSQWVKGNVRGVQGGQQGH